MIVTFYSYKGGVGRSMALANVADQLARSGLRVLIVDFDLEAPGLESFFPVDHDEVRGHEGLLDLLLSFKYSMSTASSGDDRDAFRQLDRFITTVYPERDGGGGLDLLPAGRRLTDEQIGRYGEELRRFDWLDFYFSWSGELFFEWLRKTFAERYDVVLVDSRTGVTEMGGICAYQLADAIVLLCAPNLQNLEGTDAMVRHFLSPQVRAVRGDRPLDVLIVPARVDQEDSTLRDTFRERFQERFAGHLPVALTDAGLGFWDLQIPYEPRYAFDEQVVTDPNRVEERRGLAAAYSTLLRGIALLAPEGSGLARLRPAPAAVDGAQPPEEPVETRYDPTTRFASQDVFISWGIGAVLAYNRLAVHLANQGLSYAASPDPRAQDATFSRALMESLRMARVGVVLVGHEGDRSSWRQLEIEQLLANARPVLPVLLPGVDHSAAIPLQLAGRPFLRWDPDTTPRQVHDWVRAALDTPAAGASREPQSPEANPYPGMLPFRERDEDVFLGRESEVQAMLDTLRINGACSVIGPAGAGKTSAVFAGLVPALRRGRLPGSERWPVVSIRPGDRPLESLAQAMIVAAEGVGLVDRLSSSPEGILYEILDWLDERQQRVLVIIDQYEELFTTTPATERGRFLQQLGELCGRPGNAVALVAIVRSDFFSEAAQTQNLYRLFLNHVNLEPLSGDALRSVIEMPARRLGLAFEPGLVDRLLADIADQPGAMSLLQFVLSGLWQEQREGFLTHAAYERMGGAGQALASRADTLLERLPEVQQTIVQTVLLRLVEIERGKPRRRAPVELHELVSGIGFDPAEVHSMIELLTEQRLLAVAGGDRPTQVELAYEGLLNAWPALLSWIREEFQAIEARSRLDAAALEWRAQDGDPATLLPPERVDQLLAQMSQPLSEQEHAYVAASDQYTKATRARTSWRIRQSEVVAILGLVASLLGLVPALAQWLGVDLAISVTTAAWAASAILLVVGLVLVFRWRRRR